MMAKSHHYNKEGEEEFETKVSNVCPWEVVAGEVKYHFEAITNDLIADHQISKTTPRLRM